jgi:hypothetical protein
MRAYAPVVVRGEEDKGVQLWSFGKMVYQDILNIMLDPDYGDITDPLEGRDIKVSLSKAPGQQWSKTSVMPRGKATKLSSETSKIESWTSTIPDLDEIYSLESYEEIEKKVNDWLNGSSSADDDGMTGGSTTKATTTSAPTTESTTKTTTESKSYTSLDDAFADLLGD